MNREPSEGQGRRKLKWRDYQTVRGGRPVLDEFRKLTDIEYAEVRVEMEEVARAALRPRATFEATSTRSVPIPVPGWLCACCSRRRGSTGKSCFL